MLIAESFEREASNHKGGDMARTSIMQNAIEAYRRIPNTKEKVDKLHRKLMSWQKKTRDEMQSFKSEIDITEFVHQVLKDVKGKDLDEIIRYLVISPKILSIDDLRTQVKKNAKNSPILYLVQGEIVNDDGKTLGRRPSPLSNDPEEVERAMKMEMHRTAELHRSSMVNVTIDTVRKYILRNFPLRQDMFLPIVQHSPFVPDGREEIYALGLYYGLIGKFIESTTLLVLQIENSIRDIFENQDIIVTSIDQYGVQKEFDLNNLLYMDEANNLFGKDVVFELQGLLVENTSNNIRNAIAHGLLRQESFKSNNSIYLWWLVLKLILIPIYNIQAQEEMDRTNQKQQEDAQWEKV